MIGMGMPTIQRTKLRPMIVLLLLQCPGKTTCLAAPSCSKQESHRHRQRKGSVGSRRD
jgi:hypothetical protein